MRFFLSWNKFLWNIKLWYLDSSHIKRSRNRTILWISRNSVETQLIHFMFCRPCYNSIYSQLCSLLTVASGHPRQRSIRLQSCVEMSLPNHFRGNRIWNQAHFCLRRVARLQWLEKSQKFLNLTHDSIPSCRLNALWRLRMLIVTDWHLEIVSLNKRKGCPITRLRGEIAPVSIDLQQSWHHVPNRDHLEESKTISLESR